MPSTPTRITNCHRDPPSDRRPLLRNSLMVVVVVTLLLLIANQPSVRWNSYTKMGLPKHSQILEAYPWFGSDYTLVVAAPPQDAEDWLARSVKPSLGSHENRFPAIESWEGHVGHRPVEVKCVRDDPARTLLILNVVFW